MISACCRRFQLSFIPSSKLSLKMSDWQCLTNNSGGHISLSTDANNIFSEENKKRTIDALTVDRDNTSFKNFKSSKSSRSAAVLVPFCLDIKGRPGLLCNLRSENLNSHKNEISFPGGTFEPEDNNNPVVAALRETEEELGIKRENVEVWTLCRTFPTVSTRIGVVPVVGFIKGGPVDADTLEINPSEVDHAFVIPLEHLCNSKNWSEMQPPTRLGSACFTLPTYQNLDEISERLNGIHLWGLTAFITHLVLTAFIPHIYTRKVEYISLTTEGNKNKNDNETQKSPNSKL